MSDGLENQLRELVREALSLSDAMHRFDTSIELNKALVTLDGRGVAPPGFDGDCAADLTGEPLPANRTLRIIRG